MAGCSYHVLYSSLLLIDLTKFLIRNTTNIPTVKPIISKNTSTIPNSLVGRNIFTVSSISEIIRHIPADFSIL
jgi:hypothetical protein